MTLKTPQQAYAFLKERFADITNLEYIGDILGKDEETAMAEGSADDRIRQAVALEGATHHLMTDTRVQDALDLAESDASNLPLDDQRNLVLMRHRWVHKAAVPADLAREAARVCGIGATMHRLHYKSGDWSVMGPVYKASFDAMRDVGQATQTLLGAASPYEARVDAFSPGQKVADIEREFASLDLALRKLIPEALSKQAVQIPGLPMQGPFEEDAQKILSREIVRAMGYDLNRGVQYFIHGHPSCGGSPDDSRITSRLDRDDFISGLYASIHEAGHAMYEQGLPKDWRYQPTGHSLGMDIHESQSMIMEYQAAQTEEFLTYLATRLRDVFNRHGDPAFSPDNIRRLLWTAEPSFIRVDADELTYPMHILLRFDLEKRIFDGSLNVLDLPDAWADGMRTRLGITPPDNAKGCMQDVHWPAGLQGYFPAYTLGGMGAAQLFRAAAATHTDLRPELLKGSFAPLKTWLGANVHGKGSLVTPKELFIQATGQPLNSAIYLDHLSQRYLSKPYSP